ncbi:MAG: SRPBCC domain-containing protein [Steroidobacteraceae bacterium]
MAGKTRGYAHRIDIVAPPASVWAGLLDPALIARWMGPGARVKAKLGGSYYVAPEGGFEREAHIDVFDRGRRLRLIYQHPAGLPEFDGAIVEDFLLEQEGETTIVRLLGSGIPEGKPWDQYYMKLRFGWERSLARLKVLLEMKPRKDENTP